MRLPRPYPAFLALASIPLLFDNTHTMWGANFHSTFAGMIANSYSMALFPLALASALRDVVDCRARLRSIALLAMLVMSHFFTSILLAAVLGIVFAGLLVASAVGNGGGRRLGALFADGALALMLTAWWVLPVIADRPWSVDFGDPWEIDFLGNLAVFVRWSAVPSILVSAAFLAQPLFAKDNRPAERSLRAFTAALAVLLAASVVLFFFGGAVTPVFVNCRLWPFIVFASLCLSAVAAGLLVRAGRAPVLGWAAFAATVFAWPWDGATNARLWAEYDLRGAEARPHGADFFKMVDDVACTPGRLAFDMHDGNTQLGSSRIFEALPALCGKGIVEGGILNSALGALGAYSVQGQVSDQPAGWPSRVTPLSHDLPLGLRRLELLGVRHFIARSTHVRREFDELSDWRLARDYGKWGLYESSRDNAPLVTVWDDLPVVCTADVQGAIVDWYASTNVPPAILCAAGVPYPEIGGTNCAPRECAAATADAVESWNRVTLRTDAPGKPHHLAVSYYPNWHVRGAARIYPASSGCMVVVPDGDTVEFIWGPTLPDFAGQAVSIAGLVIAAAWGIRSFRTPRTQS